MKKTILATMIVAASLVPTEAWAGPKTPLPVCVPLFYAAANLPALSTPQGKSVSHWLLTTLGCI